MKEEEERKLVKDSSSSTVSKGLSSIVPAPKIQEREGGNEEREPEKERVRRLGLLIGYGSSKTKPDSFTNQERVRVLFGSGPRTLAPIPV